MPAGAAPALPNPAPPGVLGHPACPTAAEGLGRGGALHSNGGQAGCWDPPLSVSHPLLPSLQVFQKELGKRASCIKMLKRSVRDLTRGSSSVDSQWLQKQMEELSARWDLVCKLSVSKQARLEAALRQVRAGGALVGGLQLARRLPARKVGVCSW